MAAENIRDIVLSMLLTVEKEEAYSHLLVKDVLEKYDYLPGQEKAFLKRLFARPPDPAYSRQQYSA